MKYSHHTKKDKYFSHKIQETKSDTDFLNYKRHKQNFQLSALCKVDTKDTSWMAGYSADGGKQQTYCLSDDLRSISAAVKVCNPLFRRITRYFMQSSQLKNIIKHFCTV
jgi:hypothetical protein